MKMISMYIQKIDIECINTIIESGMCTNISQYIRTQVKIGINRDLNNAKQILNSEEFKRMKQKEVEAKTKIEDEKRNQEEINRKNKPRPIIL